MTDSTIYDIAAEAQAGPKRDSSFDWEGTAGVCRKLNWAIAPVARQRQLVNFNGQRRLLKEPSERIGSESFCRCSEFSMPWPANIRFEEKASVAALPIKRLKVERPIPRTVLCFRLGSIQRRRKPLRQRVEHLIALAES